MGKRMRMGSVVVGASGLTLLSLLLLLGLTVAAQESVPAAPGDPGAALALSGTGFGGVGVDPGAAVSNTIFIPMMGKVPSATTSSATLARPPAGGPLGLLGGLLAAGLAVGLFLLYSDGKQDE